MKKIYLLQIFTMITFGSVLTTQAQNTVPIDTFRTELQNIINNATTNYGMDGIELSVIIDDSLATETFYSGLRAPGISVDTLKPWHYAQAIAGYTNYVALKLIEDTLLSMDDSIGQHMNTTAMGLDGSITVRQLIRHTSVLNEIWEPSQPSSCFLDIWITNPSVIGCPIDLLTCFPSDKAAPGTFDYNNTNLLVLQYLIDSVTGNSYETEIQNRIFTPFGMTNSYLSSCDTVTIDSINGIWTTNSGYANSQNYLRYFSTNGGNRSLISKSAEVSKFYRSLFQDKLLPSAVMDSVKEVIPGSTASQGSYSCATSIEGSQGYNTDILQIIDNLGDTAVFYGKGGLGLNGHLTLHWPKKDLTFSFAQNDRSRILQQRNLAIDIYCYLRTVDSVSTATVGLETSIEQKIDFYPNPANEVLNIKTPESFGKYDYKIMNLSGKILLDVIDFSGKTIDISFLTPGIYIMNIHSGAEYFRASFIKK